MLAVATHLCGDGTEIKMNLGSAASLTVAPTPLLFQSPVSYTDPQLLRFSDDVDLADDYGRDTGEEEAFEDAPEADAE
jgi:hypothetical protein